ncbi:MAG TPA: hydrolase [Gammaproteobacteria bacterium]|nr:hydrolase [Gammaproteobacteria bacterium]
MIVKSNFTPAWWLKNRHVQTIFPAFFRRRPKLSVRRERIEFPDGDFADCDWTGGDSGPIVIVLHGLEGSIDSAYAAGIMAMIERCGWRGALLHFRGCSGEPNRLATGYHSGFTADLDFLVKRIRSREPNTPLAAIGFSLGGNVLLKWLGEGGDSAPLATAIAVSAPFDPAAAADTVERGLSRIYNWYLLRSMRRSTECKFRRMKAPLPLPKLASLKTFRQFDDAVTAPLHGFSDAADYYHRNGSRRFLRAIEVPTLLLQSADDPVVGAEAIPNENELAPSVTLEISNRGGHVGFVSGRWPWRARYWLEDRIRLHLLRYLGEANVRPMKAATHRPRPQSPATSPAGSQGNSATGK